MEPAVMTQPSPTEPMKPASRAGNEGDAKKKRKLRNYLLDTGLQLRLASYLLAVAVILSGGLGWLLWSAYREASRAIALGDPVMGDSIAQAFAAEDRWRMILVSVALAGVLICLLGAAVVITHRIAGPAFAIARTCRQVEEGRLTRPRPLRDHDLLVELAEAVASMVDALRAREATDREALVRAGAALRDPGATPDGRAALAGELERLAAEKEARLKS